MYVEVESGASITVMEAPIATDLATELAPSASPSVKTDGAKEATSSGSIEDAQKMVAASAAAPLISIDETVMVSAITALGRRCGG